jgi:uncharacterized protein YceH (UPF0502 family)
MAHFWGQKQHDSCDSRKNRAMKKEATQDDWIKRNTRFPPEVFVEVADAAARNGRSFNAEVIARLRVDEIAELRHEVAELKNLVQEVLGHVRK